MEIRNILTFLKVAGTQNFSKAAEQLGYSQSAVTIQIQQLEKELGTQLFERIDICRGRAYDKRNIEDRRRGIYLYGTASGTFASISQTVSGS